MRTRKKSAEHGREWQLQEAKNCLSRVIEEARRGTSQTITLRGTPVAVVVSFGKYQELIRPRSPLSEFFRSWRPPPKSMASPSPRETLPISTVVAPPSSTRGKHESSRLYPPQHPPPHRKREKRQRDADA